jgi:hypothetical protein
MPGTGNPAITSNNAILQRRAIMAAPRREGMHLIIKLDKEDFSIWDALNLDLNLIQKIERGKGAEIL